MNKASGHESHQCEKNPNRKKKRKRKRKNRKEQRVRGEKCWWRREVRRGQRRKIKGEKERIRVRVGNVESSFLSQSAAHYVLSVPMFILY